MMWLTEGLVGGLCVLRWGFSSREPKIQRALDLLCGVGLMAALVNWWGFHTLAFSVALSAGLSAVALGYGLLKLPVAVVLGGFGGILLYDKDWPLMVALFSAHALTQAALWAQAQWVLYRRRATASMRVKPCQRHYFVCSGARCQQQGACLLYEAMQGLEDFKMRQGTRLSRARCLGFCDKAPVILREPEGALFFGVRVVDLKQIGLRWFHEN